MSDDYDFHATMFGHLENLILEAFDWLEHLMPEDFDRKAARKRIGEILDSD